MQCQRTAWRFVKPLVAVTRPLNSFGRAVMHTTGECVHTQMLVDAIMPKCPIIGGEHEGGGGMYVCDFVMHARMCAAIVADQHWGQKSGVMVDDFNKEHKEACDGNMDLKTAKSRGGGGGIAMCGGGGGITAHSLSKEHNQWRVWGLANAGSSTPTNKRNARFTNIKMQNVLEEAQMGGGVRPKLKTKGPNGGGGTSTIPNISAKPLACYQKTSRTLPKKKPEIHQKKIQK